MIDGYKATIMSSKYEVEKYTKREKESWKIIEENSLIYSRLLSAIKNGEFQIKIQSLDDKTINAFKFLGYKVKKVKKRWYRPNSFPYVSISWYRYIGDYWW